MINFLRTFFVLLSAVIFGLITPFDGYYKLIFISFMLVFSLAIVISIEYAVHSISVRALFSCIFGLICGLILSLLIVSSLSYLPIALEGNILLIIQASIIHLITFFVVMFFVINHEEISFFDKIIPSKLKDRDGAISYKILDTSVIIDGRISDICDTGFIEGILVIPNFVLHELQGIADSADSMKRNRGRRGLDILNRMQKDQSIKVKISDLDFPEIAEVDSKLVKLAKVMDAVVVTNDFNLNKVAEFHGVKVLNINELANLLKPVVLPGEEMHVSLIKEGKEHDQAIGYLDDGTMIVVEDGRPKLSKDVDVVVTSVLQTTAGRMIFAKLKGGHH